MNDDFKLSDFAILHSALSWDRSPVPKHLEPVFYYLQFSYSASICHLRVFSGGPYTKEPVLQKHKWT